jgi:hypothetical protein
MAFIQLDSVTMTSEEQTNSITNEPSWFMKFYE